MQLRRIGIKEQDLLTDRTILKVGVQIDSVVQAKINPTIISRKHLRDKFGEQYRGVAVYKPDGSLLFLYLPDVISKSIWLPAYKLLNTVSGGLDNRPSIVGENMRQRRRDKSGKLGNFKAVPLSVMETISKGKAGILGAFRFRNRRPDGTHCETRTKWTRENPEVWLGTTDFRRAIDEIYREEPELAELYAIQKKYMDTVKKDYKSEDTNVTSLYILKDHATAIHVDNFDEHGTFGVMATLGDPDDPWQGNEIVWPEYRIGCDYRPADLLFGDVHSFHGNLALTYGTRISCIFFVRTKMHQCPD